MVDPNPLVRGRGVRQLRQAGIEVKTGVLRQACERLNEDFTVFIRTGRPFVTLKLAVSLDGRIATATGDSRWISGEASRRVVHELRNRADAVLVGAETVRIDDPQLTSRIRGGRDPLRVIIDGRLSINPQARVCTQRSTAATLVVTTQHAARGERKRRFEQGGQTAAAALQEDVVDKVLFFYAPLLLGGDGRAMIGPLGIERVAAGLKLHTIQLYRLGDDLLVSAYVGKKGG
jgi:diaminohydroxyphosphoribosylaminopyrimidine deaminase/5-amino-6-(5-phosphoribosylamino)uracil reductase